VSHPNAPLTVEGRRRLCERVAAGRPICHVAAEAGVARATLGKWYARWRAEGEAGLVDRSSRPRRSPKQTDREVQDLIGWLRRGTKLGPVMPVAELAAFGIQLAASTIHRVLVRLGISRLRDLDVTGDQVRQPARRYEHPVPGAMVHVDVKKLGRIPDGGGWRVHGRGSDAHRASKRQPRPGYAYLHTIIDDHSRLAYAEQHRDETAATAAGFWQRAVAFFAAHGIDHIHRVLTDNGSAYRSKVFNAAVAAGGTHHRYTRPYRPQTNGKIERFHRTLAREWAYQRAWDTDQQRADALPDFLHRYNYHRPHTAVRGLAPVMRTPTVTNLSGHNT
jgi:transposase InsO family protein